MIFRAVVLLFLLILGAHFSSTCCTRICFHDTTLNERGTSSSTYDFAEYAEIILGYQSHILHADLSSPLSAFTNTEKASSVVQKYKVKFNTSSYMPGPGKFNGKPIKTGGSNLARLAESLGCDALYIQKAGQVGVGPPYPMSILCNKTAIHAVFNYQKHGTTYAVLCPHIASTRHESEVVPLIVRPPPPGLYPSVDEGEPTGGMDMIKKEDVHGVVRKRLGISERDLVLCNHGGSGSFNVPLAFDGMRMALQQHEQWKVKTQGKDLDKDSDSIRRNLHFILLNTKVPRDMDSFKQIHRLPATVDAIEKERFFYACDAMLHGRSDGETFGMAIGEMSVRNKPIITCSNRKHSHNNEHLRILGDKAFLYDSAEDLLRVIQGLFRDGVDKEKSYNAYYPKYGPREVMRVFNKTLLSPIIDKKLRPFHEWMSGCS